MSLYVLVNKTGGLEFSAAEVGKWVEIPHSVCAIEAVMGAVGSVFTATVEIHGSNRADTVPNAKTKIGDLTLSGSKDAASLTTQAAAYKYKLAKVTAIGTGAIVSVSVGV